MTTLNNVVLFVAVLFGSVVLADAQPTYEQIRLANVENVNVSVNLDNDCVHVTTADVEAVVSLVFRSAGFNVYDGNPPIPAEGLTSDWWHSRSFSFNMITTSLDLNSFCTTMFNFTLTRMEQIQVQVNGEFEYESLEVAHWQSALIMAHATTEKIINEARTRATFLANEILTAKQTVPYWFEGLKKCYSLTLNRETGWSDYIEEFGIYAFGQALRANANLYGTPLDGDDPIISCVNRLRN